MRIVLGLVLGCVIGVLQFSIAGFPIVDGLLAGAQIGLAVGTLWALAVWVGHPLLAPVQAVSQKTSEQHPTMRSQILNTPFPQSQQNPSSWTARTVGMNAVILDRMEQAVAKVRERLLRATSALNQIGVPYAVVGGNAVASWVATVDEGAVRTEGDIDLLVRRSDLSAVTTALEQAGFVRDEDFDVVMFRDGAEGKPSEAVHLLFAGEKLRPDHALPAPDIQTIDDPANYRVIALESLILMQLMSNRDTDRTHLCDLIGVGLIDSSWLPKLPPELAERLKQILDNPDA
jgi:hypothetical protein